MFKPIVLKQKPSHWSSRIVTRNDSGRMHPIVWISGFRQRKTRVPEAGKGLRGSLACLTILLCLGLLVSGCAELQPNIGSGRQPAQSLELWVKDTLAPYLARQLGRHPKFKGRPFLLVDMANGEIQGEIDGLSEQIRNRLTDTLLKEPGLRLAWRPAARPWRQGLNSLETLNCSRFDEVVYFIGIEAGLETTGQKLSVRVRGLNVQTNTWESGLGQSWSGRVTQEQKTLLRQSRPDEVLRGLRVLPFQQDQPDLLASFLSHHLSCRLRQGRAERIIIQTDSRNGVDHPFFRTALSLVDNYLNNFQEVRLTEDPGQADTLIQSEVRHIHPKLYQIWVRAKDTDSGTILPGTETQAYVRLDSPPEDPAYQEPEPTEPATRPVRSELISSFSLLTPLSPAFCETKTPWLVGEREVGPGAALASGSCIALEVELHHPAFLFLLGRDGQGRMTRLFPSDCSAFSRLNNPRTGTEVFRFPPLSGSGPKALTLTQDPGREAVYAVAIRGQGLARRFAKAIAVFQGLCTDKHRSGKGLRLDSAQDSAQDWQAFLERQARIARGRLEWQVRRFKHRGQGSMKH